ncbi:hypothetical protein QP519_10450 [Weeksella virosa]|uniref:hypothetical protein n=1 Tax=Weeksella virosa TaxID=1014 RepID=UPI0025563184|nr:hypothetical protein [Weeksella virosa]MDK7375954.1 hypothetical protein [Weeksella virosa]
MVMNIEEVKKIINNKSVSNSKLLKEARNTFYAITLHTKGARPSFKDLSSPSAGTIYPPDYLGEEYQRLFDKFLLSKHPREEDVTRQWRYSQYRPLTKSPFQRLIKVVKGMIYQDTKYTLKVENKTNEEYLNGANFQENNNFISLFKNIFVQAMLEDPNGYIVIIPTKHRKETLHLTEPLEISFLYVRSIDIIHDENQDLIFKTQDGNHVFWINKTDIIRFKKNQKNEWVNEAGYFNHKFSFIPAVKLGGIYANNNFYKSFLDDALPIADEYISSHSSEQLIDKEASYPYIQQATIDCPTCHGIGSTQEIVEICELYPNGTKQVPCSTCQGKKQISINPAERYEVPVDNMDRDMVRIINPNIAVNQYHRDKNRDIFNAILDSLNLLKVDEAQSGVAKTIDRDNLYQFASNISDRLFELKEFCLKCFIAYRLPDPKFEGGFTLIKPYKFDTQTANDLLSEIQTAIANGLPLNVRLSLINDFVEKRFKGNDVQIKINQVLSILDKTYGLTIAEIKDAKDIGYITEEDIANAKQIKDSIQKIILDNSFEYIREKKVSEIINYIHNKDN